MLLCANQLTNAMRARLETQTASPDTYGALLRRLFHRRLDQRNLRCIPACFFRHFQRLHRADGNAPGDSGYQFVAILVQVTIVGRTFFARRTIASDTCDIHGQIADRMTEM